MYESANLTSALLLIAALAGLLTAIVRFKAHPFLALLLTALFFGWAMGLPSDQVIEVVLTGFAETLKWIGIVMVLGTLIGEILNETGGSQRIADSILGWIGEKRVPVAMAVTGYVVSIPVFVDVAYITLVPIAEALAVKSKRNILGVGLALAAGLTATHALLPPTPGPLAVTAIAVVIMITSAGGAFGAIIKASDVAPAVSTALESLGLPGLFFPFFLALGLTTATGSLTVSMVTSASIVAPMLSGLKLSPETAVALIGAGSVCVTHANASFFWLLTRLHGVPPNVLYRTYSVQSLFMGLGGFLAVVLLHISGIAN